MDSTLVAAYIGAGSAIVGVILGGAIAGVGSWYGRSRRRKNVRRVLFWEHAYNIGMLEEYWKLVNQEGQPQVHFDAVKEFERNLRLAEENLDEWGIRCGKVTPARLRQRCLRRSLINPIGCIVSLISFPLDESHLQPLSMGILLKPV